MQSKETPGKKHLNNLPLGEFADMSNVKKIKLSVSYALKINLLVYQIIWL